MELLNLPLGTCPDHMDQHGCVIMVEGFGDTPEQAREDAIHRLELGLAKLLREQREADNLQPDPDLMV